MSSTGSGTDGSSAMGPQGPIGVFDSGIGGLSVLRHIRDCLPHEELLYFADSAYAPYGDRTEQEIVDRSLSIASFLLQNGSKALVVACNTATAAAIRALRGRYPALPVVGVEPGLKPAAATTKNGIVGVLATRRTLASLKFEALREQISAATGVQFLPQACIGLADQIEKGELHSPATALLLRRYVEPLLEQGADTLVLGCTHYPFIRPLLEEIIGHITPRPISTIDTGTAVARQLARLLTERTLLYGIETPRATGVIKGFTTASVDTLTNAFSKLLAIQPSVQQLILL
jgi:glutamate racemase